MPCPHRKVFNIANTHSEDYCDILEDECICWAEPEKCRIQKLSAELEQLKENTIKAILERGEIIRGLERENETLKSRIEKAIAFIENTTGSHGKVWNILKGEE
jgi:hypothetical protein